jgi:hypothetical protein
MLRFDCIAYAALRCMCGDMAYAPITRKPGVFAVDPCIWPQLAAFSRRMEGKYFDKP